MKVRPRRSLLPLFALGCLSALACGGANPVRDRGADEAAIRATVAANEGAAKKHDAAGVAATYTEDADLIVGSQSRVARRDAIRRAIEAGYAASPPLDVSITVESIRFVVDDVAIVECHGLHRFAAGETRDRATMILVRGERGWLIAAVRVLPAVQA